MARDPDGEYSCCRPEVSDQKLPEVGLEMNEGLAADLVSSQLQRQTASDELQVSKMFS